MSSHNHRLRANAASKTLTSVDGTMWTGEVYMGSERESFDVIFDNSSDWLSLEGKDCAECEGGTYDPETSTESK